MGMLVHSNAPSVDTIQILTALTRAMVKTTTLEVIPGPFFSEAQPRENGTVILCYIQHLCYINILYYIRQLCFSFVQ